MKMLPSFLEGLSAGLARLSNDELLEHVGQLAGDERTATTRLIASLAEVDKRQLYRDAGCSSLFTFCTDVLRLSESEAYLRIEAARAARRFPLILERLADASMTITAVSKLATHLTEGNHRELIDAVRHKSKREILLARVHPQPDAKEMVRRLPVRASAGGVIGQATPPQAAANECSRGERACDRQSHVESDQSVSPDAFAVATSGGATASPTNSENWTAGSREGGFQLAETLLPGSAAIAVRPRGSVSPLAPERYKVQLTIGAETEEKLRRVRDLLRHEIPDGNLEKVFDRAIARLLTDLEKRRFAATDRRNGQRPAPRANTRPRRSHSRHIPAAVKREVWLRDQGRCSFVGPHGRCRERGMLEYHHREPFAAGGEATASNVRLLCAAHNALEADLYLGPRSSAIHSAQAKSFP